MNMGAESGEPGREWGLDLVGTLGTLVVDERVGSRRRFKGGFWNWQKGRACGEIQIRLITLVVYTWYACEVIINESCFFHVCMGFIQNMVNDAV